jgi:hypothetical protein
VKSASPIRYVDSVALADLTEDLSGSADRDDAAREVAGDDGAGTNHGVVADRHARAQGDAADNQTLSPTTIGSRTPFRSLVPPG